ncbi:MAG: hypothetical protein E7228_06395 [Clostridiales bacterium]|nr:hypothetical protein [Clostridiales bacterium]
MKNEIIKPGEYKHPWRVHPDPFMREYKKRTSRLIDLKIKGLPFDDRQEIFKLIDNLGSRMMEYMAEEKDGFVVFHAIGYSDEQITAQKRQTTERLIAVNDHMDKVGRPHLFSDPEDTYRSAWEYFELMRYQYDDEFAEKYLK